MSDSFRKWLHNALVPDYNPVTQGCNGNSGWLLGIIMGCGIAVVLMTIIICGTKSDKKPHTSSKPTPLPAEKRAP